jgi:hypothetical protein
MAVSTIRLAPPAIGRPLWGFGAQFDTALFTRKGEPDGLAPGQLPQLEALLGRLKPGHSRVAVVAEAVPQTPAGQEQRAALMSTVELVQHAGANVNLTWWHGPYPPDPQARKALMGQFADLIEEARRHGPDSVTHITIQNEVNSHDIAHQHDPQKSMELYELLYRDLDDALKTRPDPAAGTRTLRAAVRLVGGDLVEHGAADQDAWLAFMQRHMADVLDGYSIHVYWVLGDFGKFERRLAHLEQVVADLGVEKPIYVTEFGVKATNDGEPGTIGDVNVEDMVETAFQHGWFDALAPQRGCVGLSKWVLYRTDGQTFGQWGMIDAPGKGFDRKATYRVTRLFSHVVDRGWRAAGLGQVGEVLVSAFAGPRGEHSVVTLNRGREAAQVRVEGLRAGARYSAVLWNRDRDGQLHPLAPVAADAQGGASVDVPSLGIVALSTRAIAL